MKKNCTFSSFDRSPHGRVCPGAISPCAAETPALPPAADSEMTAPWFCQKFARVNDSIQCDVRNPFPRTITMRLDTSEAAAYANSLLMDPKSGWRLAARAEDSNVGN